MAHKAENIYCLSLQGKVHQPHELEAHTVIGVKVLWPMDPTANLQKIPRSG